MIAGAASVAAPIPVAAIAVLRTRRRDGERQTGERLLISSSLAIGRSHWCNSSGWRRLCEVALATGRASLAASTLAELTVETMAATARGRMRERGCIASL